MLKKIISGGQTGADQGGWQAAERLGLETGGMMPKGFRTESGPRPEFAKLYHATEDTVKGYEHRTGINVEAADATVIFGDPTSAGSKKTIQFCKRYSKPYLIIRFRDRRTPVLPANPITVRVFCDWIKTNRVETLNVAGNRESIRPGIESLVAKFLYNALYDHQSH